MKPPLLASIWTLPPEWTEPAPGPMVTVEGLPMTASVWRLTLLYATEAPIPTFCPSATAPAMVTR